MLNSGEDEVLAAVERQANQVRQLEKQLADAKRKSAVSGVDSLLESSREIKGVKVLPPPWQAWTANPSANSSTRSAKKWAQA